MFEDHWQQQLQPKINVPPSGCPHNPSWPTIFLLMFVIHSSVIPPHRRLLSGVSCPSPLKFPFQITQVTVFNDSLHFRCHEDHFPLLSRLHRGSGSEGPRSEASRSEESAPWSICRRRLGSLRAPNFECSRADQSWQVGSFSGLVNFHTPSMHRAALWGFLPCRIYHRGLILLCLRFDASGDCFFWPGKKYQCTLWWILF